MLAALGRALTGLCGRSSAYDVIDGFIGAEVDSQREGIALHHVETEVLLISELEREMLLTAMAYDQMHPEDLRRSMVANQLLVLDQQLKDARLRHKQWNTALRTVQVWNTQVGHMSEIRKNTEFVREFKASSMRDDAPNDEDVQDMQQANDDMSTVQAAIATQSLVGAQVVHSGADQAAAIMSSAAKSSLLMAPPGSTVALGGAHAQGQRTADEIVASLRGRMAPMATAAAAAATPPVAMAPASVRAAPVAPAVSQTRQPPPGPVRSPPSRRAMELA